MNGRSRYSLMLSSSETEILSNFNQFSDHSLPLPLSQTAELAALLMTLSLDCNLNNNQHKSKRSHSKNGTTLLPPSSFIWLFGLVCEFGGQTKPIDQNGQFEEKRMAPLRRKGFACNLCKRTNKPLFPLSFFPSLSSAISLSLSL